MSTMPAPSASPDLAVLLDLFYESPAAAGQFVEVSADELPPVYRRLLAHEEHMTVTVEEHHGSKVDVEVLESQMVDSHYARKIRLRRQSDGQVVLFGIVRLDFTYLDDDVRREITDQQTPLGRILITHNVLRRVKLAGLWRIEPSRELAGLLCVEPGATVFGRTALIHCNGEPAVELLEIVTPV